MKKITLALLIGSALLAVAAPQPRNPFLGRWDLTLAQTANSRFHGSWLGVSERNGKVEVFFQGTSAHVVPVESFELKGTHMSVLVNKDSEEEAATTLELDIADGKITGVQKRRAQSVQLTGVRAPDMKRAAPAAWAAPEPLFNGKNLDGWEAVSSAMPLNWVVQEGQLINGERGGNIRTARAFDDFKLHFEVWCPQRANSGFYLRGRYEIQISGGPGSPVNPAPPAAPKGPAAKGGARAGGGGYISSANRAMGALYGRLTPSSVLTTPPDGWDKFDVTLVGRIVTIVRNGVTTIDRKEIEGITGGALDPNEGEPGPFYIQGDHGGNVKFRNITIALPKR